MEEHKARLEDIATIDSSAIETAKSLARAVGSAVGARCAKMSMMAVSQYGSTKLGLLIEDEDMSCFFDSEKEDERDSRLDISRLSKDDLEAVYKRRVASIQRREAGSRKLAKVKRLIDKTGICLDYAGKSTYASSDIVLVEVKIPENMSLDVLKVKIDLLSDGQY